jgi:molybdopterin molybdotransferase
MALLPVDEALRLILIGVKPLASETINIRKAHGRILAAPLKATRDQPPFDASAMDGYALRQEDIAGELKVIGTSAAGHSYKGTVKEGTAVRILTGAPLPKGADTIVIQENVTRDGDGLRITQATAAGKNIRRRGLDFKKGDTLLHAGIRLNARDIGLAAAGNADLLRIRKNPRVVVLTTGDELVLPGQRPRADQIVSSNSLALEAMFRAWDAEVINLGIVPDRLKATEAAIRKGLDADVLVTTGGASVGDHDFVQQALKNVGVNIAFWKIALRPGKPLMFGGKGRTRVLGLPGNPVSALVCARIFIRPLLRALQGLPTEDAPQLATLDVDLPENDNRQDYLRSVLITHADGSRSVAPAGLQDSSMQRTLRDSQALIVRPPHAPAATKGSQVPVLLLDF